MVDAPDDPDIAAIAHALNGPAPAGPSQTTAENDPDIQSIAQALSGSNSAPAAHSTPKVPTGGPSGGGGGAGQGMPVAPTVPTDALPAHLNVAQTLQGAVHNFVPSAENAVGSIWNAVTHPVQTVKGIAALGTGLGSQALDVAGVHQDPATRARSQAVLKSLETQKGQEYGSTQGFAHYVASDPVGFLTDASTLLDGAGAVADAAKLGTVADALHAASPLGMAGKIAAAPVAGLGKAGATILRGIQSGTTGVPYQALRTAAAVGAEGSGPMKDIFMQAAKGQLDPTEYLQRAQTAIGALRAERSQAYLADNAAIANIPVDYTHTYNALDQAASQIGMGSPSQASKSLAVIDEARNAVDEVANDPTRQTLDHADALKKQIWDLSESTNIPSASKALQTGIYHGITSDIGEVSPEYAGIMERYQQASNNINNIQKTLIGAKNNPAATAAMMKALRAFKNPDGSTVLDQLADKDPAIPYMLAGASVAPMWRQGIPGTLEWLGSGALAMHNPLAAAGALFMQSPRLAGMTNQAIGAASRGAGAIGSVATPATEAAFQANRAQPTVANPPAAPTAPTAPVGAMAKNLASMAYPDKVAWAEARNNPSIQNMSGGSAVGLGQFTPQTWLSMVKKYRPDLAQGKSDADILALRTDGDLSKQMIDAYGNENGQYLQNNGIPVNDATKYGSAWLGPAGFKTLYNADSNTPMTELADTLGLSKRDLARNRFDKMTVGDVKNVIQRRMGVPVQSASGGRIQLASGGKVPHTEEELVQRLMNMAGRAKKAANENTKPLLHVPDNVVAKALDVAQRAI